MNTKDLLKYEAREALFNEIKEILYDYDFEYESDKYFFIRNIERPSNYIILEWYNIETQKDKETIIVFLYNDTLEQYETHSVKFELKDKPYKFKKREEE